MKKIIYILALGLTFGCGNTEEKSNVKVSSSENDTLEKIEPTIRETDDNSSDYKSFGLELFTNIEQIEYCIPLPLKAYKIMESDNLEKAAFRFENIGAESNYIELQGFFRSDELSTKEYFEEYYLTAEEEGKIIKTKKLHEEANCFEATGYYSNFPEHPFIEYTWLRKDEVVRLMWFWNTSNEEGLVKNCSNIWISGSECNKYEP